MAHKQIFLVATSYLIQSTNSLTTCPGFPGYCSESFPGQTCNVVCSFGRNNVPLCQDDGTWTDIPRCIEHEPGVDEQIPGLCPGISGYCSQGFLNQKCQFDCRTGPDIDSICTSDGTWVPYPVCDGDLRETRDGCDGCPGPVGGVRNRTAEAILGTNNNIDRARVPRIGSQDSGRKKIPTFAGTTSFGVKESQEQENAAALNNIILGADGRIQQRPQQPTARPQAQFPFSQPNQQRPTPARRQPAVPTPPQRRPAAANNFQTGFQQQQPRQQPPRRPAAGGQPSEPITSTLFNQIRDNINTGNRQQQGQQTPVSRLPPQPTSQTALPVQSFFPENTAATGGPAVGNDQTFGPFEAVDFNNALAGSQRQRAVPSRQPARVSSRPATNSQFFGEFQQVNLQG
eukprot:TRINITY_DN2679_c0_g2_i1.p1 TRINITY_DN2679_c0_g2~~TRINITY_DN2679_c0_g2_i1.p1  ORF type:complete len:400 (-),score=119.69 TRINITY_DN2679_c0_g2_i1:316-1515(-)